jgi:hypothetical protein
LRFGVDPDPDSDPDPDCGFGIDENHWNLRVNPPGGRVFSYGFNRKHWFKSQNDSHDRAIPVH